MWVWLIGLTLALFMPGILSRPTVELGPMETEPESSFQFESAAHFHCGCSALVSLSVHACYWILLVLSILQASNDNQDQAKKQARNFIIRAITLAGRLGNQPASLAVHTGPSRVTLKGGKLLSRSGPSAIEDNGAPQRWSFLELCLQFPCAEWKKKKHDQALRWFFHRGANQLMGVASRRVVERVPRQILKAHKEPVKTDNDGY